MKRLFMLHVLFILSGCAGRVIDWAKDTVYQGSVLPDFSERPKAFLRSVAIYDQFETIAIFDALWVADPVRVAFAQLHACKYCLNEEQHNVFACRQLAENEQFLTFYVLSLYAVPLKENDSEWSIFLDLDGLCLAPVEIKAVDLGPEYKAFFGKNYSRFKVPYVVKFAVHDLNNVPLITRDTKTVSLVFRSISKEGRLIWDLDCLQKIPVEHQSGCCVKP